MKKIALILPAAMLVPAAGLFVSMTANNCAASTPCPLLSGAASGLQLIGWAYASAAAFAVAALALWPAMRPHILNALNECLSPSDSVKIAGIVAAWLFLNLALGWVLLALVAVVAEMVLLAWLECSQA